MLKITKITPILCHENLSFEHYFPPYFLLKYISKSVEQMVSRLAKIIEGLSISHPYTSQQLIPIKKRSNIGKDKLVTSLVFHVL